MSIAITTSHDTGQHTTSRSTTQPNNTPLNRTTPNAANRLRTTMAAVRLAFTWLGVRKTLAPEQRTTAVRVFHADRELLSASKLILDTKNPAYRAVGAVRSALRDPRPRRPRNQSPLRAATAQSRQLGRVRSRPQVHAAGGQWGRRTLTV